ncbi:MAG: MATE family efflux transporter [Clostridiales Family XIII bacterium]|jgi:putative MATE family efflux protein|nr:MATE family efflux transporter [Clostridiales Family XIII bacterium]
MASYISDMTEGSEFKHLIHFSIPLLIGNVFQQFYTIINSVVVGRFLGKNALAAVGIAGTLHYMFFSLCFGLSIGVGVVISHFFGAKKEDKVKQSIGNSIYIIMLSGLLLGGLGIIFTKQVLELMQTPPEVMAETILYFRILCIGIVFVGGYNGIAAILRALGDSKTPLIFLLISNAVNVILDITFVVVLHKGIEWVAVATVCSQIVAMVGTILLPLRGNEYLHIKLRHLRLNKDIIIKITSMGIPVALQNLMIALSMVVLQGVVNRFGASAIAAFTATSRVEQLAGQPFNSMSAAMTTFTGQNLGAGKIERVRKGLRKAVLVSVTFGIFMWLIVAFFGQWIVAQFVPDPEVIRMGHTGLLILGPFFIPLGLIYVFRGLLNGTGDGIFALIIGFVEIVGRVGFALILTQVLHIGVWGIWWTAGLTWAIAAATAIIRYKQGKWDKFETKIVRK